MVSLAHHLSEYEGMLSDTGYDSEMFTNRSTSLDGQLTQYTKVMRSNSTNTHQQLVMK